MTSADSPYELPFGKPAEELTKAEATANLRYYVRRIPAVIEGLERRLGVQPVERTPEGTAGAFVALAPRLVKRRLTGAEAARLDLDHLPESVRESMRNVIADGGRFDDEAEVLLFELSNLLAETLRRSAPWCFIALGGGPKKMIDFNLPIVSSHVCSATVGPYRYSMHLAGVAGAQGYEAAVEAVRSRIRELSGEGDIPPYP